MVIRTQYPALDAAKSNSPQWRTLQLPTRRDASCTEPLLAESMRADYESTIRTEYTLLCCSVQVSTLPCLTGFRQCELRALRCPSLWYLGIDAVKVGIHHSVSPLGAPCWTCWIRRYAPAGRSLRAAIGTGVAWSVQYISGTSTCYSTEIRASNLHRGILERRRVPQHWSRVLSGALLGLPSRGPSLPGLLLHHRHHGQHRLAALGPAARSASAAAAPAFQSSEVPPPRRGSLPPATLI